MKLIMFTAHDDPAEQTKKWTDRLSTDGWTLVSLDVPQ